MKGLKLHLWLGYLLGIIFLRRPWAPFTFKSWKITQFIVPILVWTLQVVTSYNMLANSTHIFYAGSSHPLHKIMRQLIVTLSVSIYFAFFITFIHHAKSLSILLDKITKFQNKYLSSIINCPKKPNRNNKITCWKSCWMLANILCLLSLIFQVIGAALYGINAHQDGIKQETSIFYNAQIFGSILTTAMYVIYNLERSIAFAIVNSVALHVAIIYDFVCKEFKSYLTHQEDYNNKRKIAQNQIMPMTIPVLKTELGPQEIFQALKELKEISKLATKVLSPLIALILFGLVCLLSMCLFSMVIGTSDSNVTILIASEQVIYLGIIFLGQIINDVVKLRKKSLSRILLLRPNSIHGLEKIIYDDIMEFNWQITPFRLFEVNMPLLPKIISLSLGYIVLLFQFHISLDPATTIKLQANCTT